MRSRLADWFRLHAEQLLCVEQWIALLAGIGCLGVSIGCRMHFHVEPLSAAPLHWQTKALVVLRWPLAIAVGLMGTVLTRFAFAKNHKTVAGQAAAPEKTSHKQTPS